MNTTKLQSIHILLILMVVAFFLRAFPHFITYQFLACEEENIYALVDDLIVLGRQRTNSSYNEPLTPLTVYWLHLITKYDPIFLAKYFNPLVGAMTVIALYLLARHFCNKQESLCVAILFTFSEVVFARFSHFGSGEPLGFLLAILSLYFYFKQSYVMMIGMLSLTFFAHILPFGWLTFTLFLDAIVFGKWKKKIMMICLFIVTTTSILLFNPRGSVSILITPLHYIESVSLLNFANLYSITEILAGLRMFLGIVVLGVTFLTYILKMRKKSFDRVVALFLAASLMLVGMWIGSDATIYSPVRMLLYISLPLFFYFARFISPLKFSCQTGLTCTLIVVMLSSYPVVMVESLWVQDSLTKEEYMALDELRPLIRNYVEWWSDYPVHLSLMRYSNKNYSYPVVGVPILSTNMTTLENLTAASCNCKYVFLSSRMEKNAFFLTEKTLRGLRSEKLHLPIIDIWHNSTSWKLIYDNYGVKVYEQID